MRTSLSKDTSIIKFYQDLIGVSRLQSYESNRGTMPDLAMLKNPLKLPGSAHPDVDDFPIFDHFFLVSRYISRKIFTNIQSVVLRREVANRQTKSQKETPGKTNLLGGGKKKVPRQKHDV